jgi:hypothetical protein
MVKKLVMSFLYLMTLASYAQETFLTKDEWFNLFHQQNKKDQEILFSEIGNYYFLVHCLAENPTSYRKIIGNAKAKKYLYADLTEQERNHYTHLEALRKHLTETQNRDFAPSAEMNQLMKNFLLISGYMKIEQDPDNRYKLFNIFDATDEECVEIKNSMRELYEEVRLLVADNSQ